MAKVVGGELQLVALRAERPGRRHDTGVVDEYVQPRVVGAQPVGEGADRIEIGQVEAAHLQAGARLLGGDLRGRPAVPLILRTPPCALVSWSARAQWRDDLSAELARRLVLDPSDLYPQLAAGMALTAFDAVLQRWSESDGADDPTELTVRAFAVIAPGLDSVERS